MATNWADFKPAPTDWAKFRPAPAPAPKTLPVSDVGGNLAAVGKEANKAFLQFAAAGGGTIQNTIRGAGQWLGIPDRDLPARAVEGDSIPARAGRFAGETAQMLVPIPGLDELKGVEALGKAARYLPAAIRSGTFEGLQPGKSKGERLLAGAEGAALGAFGESLAPLIAKFGAPAVSAAADDANRVIALARKYSIPIPLFRVFKSRFAGRLESATAEMPMSGFTRMVEKTRDSWNAAVAKAAGMPTSIVNRRTVADAMDAAKDDYTDLWESTHSNIDAAPPGASPLFSPAGRLARIKLIADRRSSEAASRVPKVIAWIGAQAEKNDGILDGKQLHSLLKNELGSMYSSNDSDVRGLARDIALAVRSGMPEDYQRSLSALDSHYRDLKSLQSATKRSGGALKLHALIKQSGSKWGLTPKLQELAELGEALKPPRAGSPTASRLLFYRMLYGLGGAAVMTDEIKPALALAGTGIAAGNVLNSSTAGAAALALRDYLTGPILHGVAERAALLTPAVAGDTRSDFERGAEVAPKAFEHTHRAVTIATEPTDKRKRKHD